MAYSNNNKMILELSKIELNEYLTAVPISTQGMEWGSKELNNSEFNVQDVIKFANNLVEEDKISNTNEVTNNNNKNNKI